MVCARDELILFKIIEEYNTLHIMVHDFKYTHDIFKIARYKILKYIIECATADPINGVYNDIYNNKTIIEAGILLNHENGAASMKDKYIWMFIPSRYHDIINKFWSDIGEIKKYEEKFP